MRQYEIALGSVRSMAEAVDAIGGAEIELLAKMHGGEVPVKRLLNAPGAIVLHLASGVRVISQHQIERDEDSVVCRLVCDTPAHG